MDTNEDKVIADVICVLKWSVEHITHLGKHADLVDQVEEIFRAKTEAAAELLALKNEVAGLKEENAKSMRRINSLQTESDRMIQQKVDLKRTIASQEKQLEDETRQRKVAEGKLSKLMMIIDNIKKLVNEDSHDDIDSHSDHAANQPSMVNGDRDLEGQSTVGQVEHEDRNLNGQGEENDIGPVLSPNSPNTGSTSCSRVKLEDDLEGASKDTVMEDTTSGAEAIEQEDTDLTMTSSTNSPQFMDDNDGGDGEVSIISDDDDDDDAPGPSKRRRAGLRQNLKKVDYADHHEISIGQPPAPYKCVCGKVFKRRSGIVDHLTEIRRSRQT